jgi:transcription initiation factor TFIIB
VPDVVETETERTATGVLKCPSCGSKEQKLLAVDPISNIKRKGLARNYRLIVLKFELKIPVLDPIKCIGRVANKANLSEITKRKAIDLMHKIDDNELAARKDPTGLAAWVLYLSSLSDLAVAAGVTEVTIRNRTQELRKKNCLKIIR